MTWHDMVLIFFLLGGGGGGVGDNFLSIMQALIMINYRLHYLY